MEKQEAQEVLINAMGSLFAEAEIEAEIAELAGIPREEYNRIMENGLELPECIKKYREVNRKRRNYEEKLLKSEVNEQILQEAESTPEITDEQKKVPPGIKSMIEAGVLKDSKDEDGKYLLGDGHKHKDAIAWIFNQSGYDDEITPQMYYKYVSVKIKQSSIERYFSEAKNEAK